jgi:hypothetical protein
MSRAQYNEMDEQALRAIVFGRAIKCPSEQAWAMAALQKKVLEFARHPARLR